MNLMQKAQCRCHVETFRYWYSCPIKNYLMFFLGTMNLFWLSKLNIQYVGQNDPTNRFIIFGLWLTWMTWIEVDLVWTQYKNSTFCGWKFADLRNIRKNGILSVSLTESRTWSLTWRNKLCENFWPVFTHPHLFQSFQEFWSKFSWSTIVKAKLSGRKNLMKVFRNYNPDVPHRLPQHGGRDHAGHLGQSASRYKINFPSIIISFH